MKVLVVYSDGKTEEFFFDKGLITIGRSKQCDVQVRDETLSRYHCEIKFENGQFTVKDLGSANGVYYDGQKITPNVDVSFSSFIPLNISRNEIFISETTPNKVTVKKNIEEPVVKKSFEKSESFKSVPKRETVSKEKVEDSGKKKIALIVGLIVCGLILFNFLQGPAEKTSSDVDGQEVTVKGAPVELNDFLPVTKYSELRNQASCEELEVCLELDLAKSLGEGVVIDNRDYIIYKNFPNTSQDIASRKKVFLERLSTSELFKRLAKKEIRQIHLVLKDLAKNKEEVIRVDGNYYSGDEGEFDVLGYEIRELKNSPDWEGFKIRGFFLKSL